MVLGVVLGHQGVQESRGGDRRRATEVLNLVNRAGRIPLGHDMCRRPGQHRHQHAGDQPGGVGNGGGTELDIGLGVAERLDQRTRPGTIRVERVHAPLRPRCGSRGVDDDERLIRAGRAAQFRTSAVVVGVGLKLLQGEHIGIAIGDLLGGVVGPGDDDREFRMLAAQIEIHVQIAKFAEVCRSEHRPYPGVGHHVADVFAPVDRHDWDHDDAQSRQRGQYLDELHPVGQLHGGRVTASQATAVQTDSQPLPGVEELPKRQ